MKSLYLSFAAMLFCLNMNAQTTAEKAPTLTAATPVSVEQTAEKMCSCAAEHKITAIAQQYNNAAAEADKDKYKSELAIATRQMHTCMNMMEVQVAVRSLPREQRTQFEDAVQKKLMENCPEVAVALQTFR